MIKKLIIYSNTKLQFVANSEVGDSRYTSELALAKRFYSEAEIVEFLKSSSMEHSISIFSVENDLVFNPRYE